MKHEIITNEKQYKRYIIQLQKITGLLSYIANKYRFNILYYVNILARHTLYPCYEIKKLAEEVVQYIQDIRDKKLLWKKSNNESLHITAITDSAFAQSEKFKSQLGYYLEINGDVITSKSTTLSLTCISTTEAELCAINLA